MGKNIEWSLVLASFGFFADFVSADKLTATKCPKF